MHHLICRFQDCLEIFFSQMRGIGGQNRTPNAVEARCRLRQLLIAPAPVLATDYRNRAVQDEANRSFLSTSRTLTNDAFEGLDVEVGCRSNWLQLQSCMVAYVRCATC